MEYTHSQGLLHRNISSSHIFVKKNCDTRLGCHNSPTFKTICENLEDEENGKKKTPFIGEWFYLCPEVMGEKKVRKCVRKEYEYDSEGEEVSIEVSDEE